MQELMIDNRQVKVSYDFSEVLELSEVESVAYLTCVAICVFTFVSSDKPIVISNSRCSKIRFVPTKIRIIMDEQQEAIEKKEIEIIINRISDRDYNFNFNYDNSLDSIYINKVLYSLFYEIIEYFNFSETCIYWKTMKCLESALEKEKSVSTELEECIKQEIKDKKLLMEENKKLRKENEERIEKNRKNWERFERNHILDIDDNEVLLRSAGYNYYGVVRLPIYKFLNEFYELKDLTGVYVLRDITNNKIYVGQSKNVFKRIREHFDGNHRDIITEMHEKGHRFIIEQIVEGGSNPDKSYSLDEIEDYFIKYYKSNGYGYNKKTGNQKNINYKKMTNNE